MIPLVKPRGFWDYALFALAMVGLLVFLFWLEASDGIGWADAVLALGAGALFAFGVIIARRGEKATWIARPTRRTHLLASLGAFVLMFGAIYADTYLFHRRDITSKRLRNDAILAIGVTAGALWTSRRRFAARRQLF
jgi:threonine/homoserine efflux transporter RhtA